jgi:hypothetical protein
MDPCAHGAPWSLVEVEAARERRICTPASRSRTYAECVDGVEGADRASVQVSDEMPPGSMAHCKSAGGGEDRLGPRQASGVIVVPLACH